MGFSNAVAPTYPFTHTTCRNASTTSTRSFCADRTDWEWDRFLGNWDPTRLHGPAVTSATFRASGGLKRLSALLRRKMPQLASLWVEPGIPEIKRLLLPRKRAPEIRLSFRSYTPRAGTFIERDGACCFPCFVGQVRYLRGHSGLHQERPTATLGL
jgi:hypothetical protein